MDYLYKTFLIIHIISGFSSLTSSIVPIATAKGSKWHRKAGTLFFWSMVFTTFSAIAIALYKANYFLLYVGVFSFYFAYAGKRIVGIVKEGKVKLYDMAIFWLCALGCILMLAFAILQRDVILIIFGLLFAMGIKDGFLFYRNSIQKKRKQYVMLHLRFMLGACIATFTAFLVVNVKAGASWSWVPWLLPTAAGSALITYYTAQIRRRLKRA